ASYDPIVKHLVKSEEHVGLRKYFDSKGAWCLGRLKPREDKETTLPHPEVAQTPAVSTGGRILEAMPRELKRLLVRGD
ncbi:MAG: hypothetical protein AABZ61_03415, partial [Bacteroidota bacterium]